MIAPLVFRHASHWKIQKSSAWQIFYHLLSIRPIATFFAQPPGETSHCYALFLHGSRSRPAFRVASSAPEATRRCILRLGTATPLWSSSWSLRGPRWMWPTWPAVAPEEFLGRFGSGSDEVTEGVLYIGSWFSCCALGCWAVFVRVV